MKTKISQIISKSLLFAFIVLLGSCNYLDVDQYFDDTLKFDSVFTQKRYFEAYLWGARLSSKWKNRVCMIIL